MSSGYDGKAATMTTIKAQRRTVYEDMTWCDAPCKNGCLLEFVLQQFFFLERFLGIVRICHLRLPLQGRQNCRL